MIIIKTGKISNLPIHISIAKVIIAESCIENHISEGTLIKPTLLIAEKTRNIELKKEKLVNAANMIEPRNAKEM